MVLRAGPVELVVEGGGGVVLEGEETLEVALVVVQGRSSVQRGIEVEDPAGDALPSEKVQIEIDIYDQDQRFFLYDHRSKRKGLNQKAGSQVA